LEPAANLEPVEPGQTKIEHDEIEGLRERQLEPAPAVGCSAHMVVDALKMKSYQGRDIGVILDNQHPGGTHTFNLRRIWGILASVRGVAEACGGRRSVTFL
jgi:hypothetical protein